MAGAEPFRADGSGERAEVAVLCVHGLTSTPQMIRPVAEHLAGQGYAVHAPLLPGHGTTWQQMNRTRYADWLGVVEQSAFELADSHRSVVAVGVSLGGALVTDLALTHPGMVDGLVLVNPAFAATDWRLRLLPVLKHALPSMAGLAGDIRRTGGPTELAYDRLPLKAFHSFVEQWPQLVSRLPQLTEPVLLARSAHDAVVPPLSGERFLEHVGSRDVTQLLLANSAHVATLDHDVDLLLGATSDFIERVTRQGDRER
ncbi:alpha/beta hydrolase [Ornithinicoccus hortensis]|uniref:Carboxylesterase n=1 Tax=Ornithinicoccus hortensis TaxID=82346 RepID=A0A542YRF9_9MICO|nr:alpha/beta fold hydrolase [Ornithinicoccus hortensis]TQL50637.1 carboxylesterase [Ornithinicoccus hortensis]